jgi:S-adenosylmethionine:tRNA ribosyltransferase-isomerase
MHREWVSIPAQVTKQLAAARQAGGRIIVVGTTCVRALESLPDDWQTRGDFEAYTDLFIHPADEDSGAFEFRFTDALLTNFHLPRSTLIALVAALPGVGIDRIRQWYAEAIARKYRFYSYGDAMLLL